MKQLESTKLSVYMQELGQEKLTKQNFSHIAANPDEGKIMELGNIMTALAPEDTALDSVLKTEATRYF